MERNRDTAGDLPSRPAGRDTALEGTHVDGRVGRPQSELHAESVRAVPDVGRWPDRPTSDPSPSTSHEAATRESACRGPQPTGSAPPALINRVRIGMTIVDVAGEEVGTVEDVNMGDAGTPSSGAGVPVEHGLAAALLAALGEPYAPEPLRRRLLRLGYVKVGGKGGDNTASYLTTDVIGWLAGDTLGLTVRQEDLPGGGRNATSPRQ